MHDLGWGWGGGGVGEGEGAGGQCGRGCKSILHCITYLLALSFCYGHAILYNTWYITYTSLSEFHLLNHARIYKECVFVYFTEPNGDDREADNSRGNLLMRSLQRVLLSERSKRALSQDTLLTLIKRDIRQQVAVPPPEDGALRDGPVIRRRWAARSPTGSTTDRGGWGGGYGR